MDAKGDKDSDVGDGNPTYAHLKKYLARLTQHVMKTFKDETCYDGLEKDKTEAMKKFFGEWILEFRTQTEKELEQLLHENDLQTLLKEVADIKPCKDHRVPTGNPQIDARHFIGVAMHDGLQNLKNMLKKEEDKQESQENELKQIETEVSKLNKEISEEMELIAQMEKRTEDMNVNAASLQLGNNYGHSC